MILSIHGVIEFARMSRFPGNVVCELVVFVSLIHVVEFALARLWTFLEGRLQTEEPGVQL